MHCMSVHLVLQFWVQLMIVHAGGLIVQPVVVTMAEDEEQRSK